MIRTSYLKMGTVILTIMVIFAALTGCSNEANEPNGYTDLEQRLQNLEKEHHETIDHLQKQIKTLEAEIANLTQGYSDLEYEWMLTNQAMVNFPKAWPAVQTFVEAFFTRDVATLQQMLSAQHTVNENSISYLYDGEMIELPMKKRGDDATYYLNTFASSPPGLFVQIMTLEKNDGGEMTSGFINLHLISSGHKWVVEEISLDI